MKILSILRIATILLLATACLVLVVCDIDESAALSKFFIVKSLGFFAGYLLYRCLKAWERTDYYLSRYVRWCGVSEC